MRIRWTEVLRNGARELLQQAVEAEVAEFIARHRQLKDEQERQRVVRNGYLPERTIQTGIGAVGVKAPRVRDRAGEIKFSSGILPAYLRRTSQCILVVIGATAEGKKELLAMSDGYRESAQSWKELLLDLKQRGLSIDPKLAIGDGALGFWKALPQVFGSTREQRSHRQAGCWVHKTANVLNKLPKGQQGKAKAALHEIWMAESRAAAEQAFDHFLSTYEAKYAKAAECLAKDRDTLLTFYDFPAEHWTHIRTTNPIESVRPM